MLHKMPSLDSVVAPLWRITSRRLSIYVISGIAAISFIVSPCLTTASGVSLAADEGPAGPAFTDPSYRVPMPNGWEKQPIKYESWAKGADLAVTLDQHLYGTLEPLIRRYAKDNGLRIAVNEGTCGISSGMLSRKSVDIAGYCCPPGDSDRLPGIRFHTVGIASIALIVNPDNPVNNVTLAEARGIFTGEYYNWSELAPKGWKGRPPPIRTIGRLHCKTRPGHWRLLLDNEDLFGIRLQEVGTIPDMISLVAENSGAIGYEVMWMVRRYESTGRVKPLDIDGVSPTDDNALVEGRYPLYRTLNITTWEGGLAKPEAEKLKDFILKSAKDLDPKYGLVPASMLKSKGWRFMGDELVGAPGPGPSGR
jgi:phosphate transport system substrate-binding protein